MTKLRIINDYKLKSKILFGSDQVTGYIVFDRAKKNQFFSYHPS